MPRDVLIHEAAKARLRPFAVVGARRAVQQHGRYALDDDRLITKFIDTATMAALNGLLPDAGTMSRRQMEQELTDLYVPLFAGLDGMDGWFKKLTNSINKIGSKIEDGARKMGSKIEDSARKMGSKVDDVNRTIFRKVVMPITAPTVAHDWNERDKLNAQAKTEYDRWIASGMTDKQAYQNYLFYKGSADKRLDKIQTAVKVAGAVVTAFAVAPALTAAPAGAAAGSGAGANAAASAGAAAGASALLKEGATEAAKAVIVNEVVDALTPEAQETLIDYQETAAALQNDGAQSSGMSTLTWLVPTLAAAAAVALTS